MDKKQFEESFKRAEDKTDDAVRKLADSPITFIVAVLLVALAFYGAVKLLW